MGKGNHSVNHIQKIKPKVEEICHELGLQYSTEENAGRMYINLQGGPAVMPPASSYQQGGQAYGGSHNQPHGQHGGQQQPQYQQQHPQPQGNYQGGNQQNNQNDELEKLAKKFLPKVLRKLEGCCAIM